MRLRKAFLVIILVLLAGVTATAFFLPAVARRVAEKSLQATCPGSAVRIGSCIIKPLHLIQLSDIVVSKPPVYEITVKDVRFVYTLGALWQHMLSLVEVSGITVKITAPRMRVDQLGQLFSLEGKSPFLIGRAAVKDIDLAITTRDLRIPSSKISVEGDLARQEFLSVDAAIPSLRSSGVTVTGIFFAAAQSSGKGILRIGEVTYDKLTVRDIAAAPFLEGKALRLEDCSAKALDGALQGRGDIVLDSSLAYQGSLRALRLSLKAVEREFELKEKVVMNGFFSGTLEVKGKGALVTVLRGDFTADDPGGTIAVRDQATLQSIAAGQGPDQEKVVETLKNYEYNKGTCVASLEEGKIVMQAGLAGPNGKFNPVMYYNFVVEGGGQ